MGRSELEDYRLYGCRDSDGTVRTVMDRMDRRGRFSEEEKADSGIGGGGVKLL